MIIKRVTISPGGGWSLDGFGTIIEGWGDI